MYKVEEVPVNKLLLDMQNPRYAELSNQRDVTMQILIDQGAKLVNLAADIVEAGISPADLFLVTPHQEQGMYVVLEGNRRLTAIKLLLSPSMLDDMTIKSNLKKRFKTLAGQFHNNRFESVNCTIFPEREEALRWIKLRHTGENDGVGIVNWDAIQVDRFNKRFGKPSLTQQAIDYVVTHNGVDEETKIRLSEIAVTNLHRLLEDPDIRNTIGFELEKGELKTSLPPEEGVKGLAKIFDDLVYKKIDVNDIRHKKDRLRYITTFKPDQIPDQKTAVGPARSIVGTTPQEASTPVKLTTQQRSKSTSQKRKTLIPRSCVLKISPSRINDIYLELRSLETNRFPNAAAVLFRVFLETSLDHYISEKNIPLPTKPSMANKMQAVADYFEQNGIMTKSELKVARVSYSNKHHICSIDTFHAYVHNNAFIPSATDLKLSWTQLQSFIEQIWA